MADRSERLAIIVTAQDLASGKLSKVRNELNALGPGGRIAAIGMGSAMGIAAKSEQAYGHLKTRLSSLAGPLGFIGLAGAATGLGGIFEQGISKAAGEADALEKLSAISTDSTESLSALLAVTGKYGIASDQLTTIVDISAKMMGKLAQTVATTSTVQDHAVLQSLEIQKARRQEAHASTKAIDAEIKLVKARQSAALPYNKLIQLQKEYGVTLTDSSGKALGFSALLLNVADAFHSATTASEKANAAALAGQVLGRGYGALLPILALGKQGILDAEAQAKSFGLVMSQDNVAALAKFKTASEDAHQALSGLELQLGLLIMPDLTAGLTAFTGYMATHQEDVKAFFEGALHTAEGLASFVTGTVIPTLTGIGSGAKAAWDTIPAPLRDLIAQVAIGDRVIHFLFGMSPVHFILDQIGAAVIPKLFGNAVGGFFGRGSIANPMFVKNLGGLNIPGGAAAEGAGAAGAAEGAVGLAAFGITAATVGVVATGVVAALVAANVLSGAINQKGGFGSDITHPNPNIPAFVPTVTDPSVSHPISLGGKGGTFEIIPAAGTNVSYGSGPQLGPPSPFGPQLGPPAPISNPYGLNANTYAVDANTRALRILHAFYQEQLGTHAIRTITSAKTDKAIIAQGAALAGLFKTSAKPNLGSLEIDLAEIKTIARGGDATTRAALGGDIATMTSVLNAILGASQAQIGALEKLQSIKDQSQTVTVNVRDITTATAVVNSGSNPRPNQYLKRVS